MPEKKRGERKPGDPVPERKTRERKKLDEYPEEKQLSIKEDLDAKERAREAKKTDKEVRAAAYVDEVAVAWVLMREAQKMLQRGGETAEQMETFCKAAIENCQPRENYDQKKADKEKKATLHFLEVNKKAE